jgi:hypothetical protein
MELSKAEMEDIWRNKPIGYFASYKKSLKGKKRYKIKVSPFTRNYLPVETYEILARNLDEAQSEALSKWYTNYPTQPRPDGWMFNNLS